MRVVAGGDRGRRWQIEVGGSQRWRYVAKTGGREGIE
jgi:hypothetical protein